ncbi:MAG TPA: LytR C-terminal domain-containing protein [Gemmatimonadales bacterium]|nr:LytR C-terminal domain-containing protein [Gemmatimonadales bacterium]
MLLVAGVVALLRWPAAHPKPVGTAARPPATLAWPVPDGAETAIVEVMNGTDRRGLARVAARLLRSRGIDVVGYDNADSTPQTMLLVRRGDDRRARAVARALGIGKIRLAPDTTRQVDVTVVLGEDFRPEGDVHP